MAKIDGKQVQVRVETWKRLNDLKAEYEAHPAVHNVRGPVSLGGIVDHLVEMELVEANSRHEKAVEMRLIK